MSGSAADNQLFVLLVGFGERKSRISVFLCYAGIDSIPELRWNRQLCVGSHVTCEENRPKSAESRLKSAFWGRDRPIETDLISRNSEIRRFCLTQLENTEISGSRLQSRLGQFAPTPALRHGFAERQSHISVFSRYVRFDSLLKLRETRHYVSRPA